MQNKPKSQLWIVSTPIGNLGDITYRAANILKDCDYIICEDTRIANKLLDFLGLCKSLIVYNEHSDSQTRQKITNLLKSGNILALISDAGTPLISDPGYKLVEEARGNNFKIDIAPGPSAPVAALAYTGMPSDKFAFLGFPPKSAKKRQELFYFYRHLDITLILFETAGRLESICASAYETLGPKPAAIARELTKLYQEAIYFNLDQTLPSHLTLKGEMVLVIDNRNYNALGGSGEESAVMLKIKREIELYAPITSTRDLAGVIYSKYGNKNISKKTIYDLIINYKHS